MTELEKQVEEASKALLLKHLSGRIEYHRSIHNADIPDSDHKNLIEGLMRQYESCAGKPYTPITLT